MKQSAKLVRMSKIEHFIQQNDVESFRFMNISKQEVMSLRFKNEMNMLQLICWCDLMVCVSMGDAWHPAQPEKAVARTHPNQIEFTLGNYCLMGTILSEP